MTEFERAKAAVKACIGMLDGETITDVVITETTIKEIVHAVCEAFGILVLRAAGCPPELAAQLDALQRSQPPLDLRAVDRSSDSDARLWKIEDAARHVLHRTACRRDTLEEAMRAILALATQEARADAESECGQQVPAGVTRAGLLQREAGISEETIEPVEEPRRF